MKNKILFIAGLSLFFPLVSLAKYPDTAVKPEIQTEETSTIEVQKQESKKDELKRQLTDSVNTFSAIVNSLTRLSKRVSDREEILVTQGGLGDEAKDKIDIKRKILDEKLSSLNDKINSDLTKSAGLVADAGKPTRPLKEFKKEANKIKVEIVAAHKLLIDIIELVMKESL